MENMIKFAMKSNKISTNLDQKLLMIQYCMKDSNEVI